MKIALYGKLRSGKTAVCEHIMDKYENVQKIEFSDALQEVVDILYPELKGVKNREVLVGVGQHMRKYDVDVWTNIVKNRVLNSDARHILVSGVRQQNEYEMLKGLGFIFIRVEASENTRIKRCIEAGDSFNKESLRDYTEMIMDEWEADYTILNEYGFKELEISIKNILNDIHAKELKNNFFRDKLEKFRERTEVEV